MSADAAIFTRSWQVGASKVTLTVPRLPDGRPGIVVMEWDSELPQRLGNAEWQQYRAGRDAAIRDMAREMGLNIAVVEV